MSSSFTTVRLASCLLGVAMITPSAAFASIQAASLHVDQHGVVNPFVGHPITLTADATSTTNAEVEFRFEVALAGTPYEVVRPYSAATDFEWIPMREGTFVWRVTARERGDTAEVPVVVSRTIGGRGGGQIVTPAFSSYGVVHPMVALASIGPAVSGCTTGMSMRIEHRRLGTTPWEVSDYVPCESNKGTHFFVAGMRSSSTYQVRYTRRMANGSTSSGQVMTYGTPPTMVDLPLGAYSGSPVGTAHDTVFGLAIYDPDGVPMEAGAPSNEPMRTIPMAHDLFGVPIWYYPGFEADPTVVATNLTPDDTVLMLASGDAVDGSPGRVQQVVREVTLAGNVVREVPIRPIADQLAAFGVDPSRILGFDHDAVRWTSIAEGGRTWVKVAYWEPFEAGSALENLYTAGPGAQAAYVPDGLLGEILVALDEDLQVVWHWSSLAELPQDRPPTGSVPEVCLQGIPGCPAVPEDLVLIDWTHGNAIAPAPNGDVLYSMRSQDWVVRLDTTAAPADPAIQWVLGGNPQDNAAATGLTWPKGVPAFLFMLEDTQPANPSNPPTPLAPTSWGFDHQHGANYESPTTITLFDNGNNRCGGAGAPCSSRGQTWQINETNMTAARMWNVSTGELSVALGMAQRLSDGSHHFTVGQLMSVLDEDGLPPAPGYEGPTYLYNRSLHMTFPSASSVFPSYTLELPTSGNYRTYRLSSMYAASLLDRTL
jgi:hypothetical protein